MNTRYNGLTLTELLVALVLIGIVITMLTTGYIFIARQFTLNITRTNVNRQIDYALENIKLHFISAIKIDDNSLFGGGITSEKNEFRFWGEQDIYNITPDNLLDNIWYHYFVGALDNTSGLLLSTAADKSAPETLKEVLIDGRYNPEIKFEFNGNPLPPEKPDEPNFLRVTITAGPSDTRVTKLEGIRFWFTDVAK